MSAHKNLEDDWDEFAKGCGAFSGGDPKQIKMLRASFFAGAAVVLARIAGKLPEEGTATEILNRTVFLANEVKKEFLQ